MEKDINDLGLNLIKHFESLCLESYQDSVGVWTIGWGHTKNVETNMNISKEEAEEFLKSDLIIFEKAVSDLVKIDLNDNQFSALVSFAFNLGSENLAESTLLKYINNNEMEKASDEFIKWSHAGGKLLAGLVKRRLSEKNLFCSNPNIIVESLPLSWEDKYPNI